MRLLALPAATVELVLANKRSEANEHDRLLRYVVRLSPGLIPTYPKNAFPPDAAASLVFMPLSLPATAVMDLGISIDPAAMTKQYSAQDGAVMRTSCASHKFAATGSKNSAKRMRSFGTGIAPGDVCIAKESM